MATITGTAGDDTLDDTAGADTIDGLGGNDTIRSYYGPDTIFGGTGNDWIAITRSNDGSSGTVSVDGGADNDSISVSTLHANYTVNATGGAGQDDFYAGSTAGAVIFDGGADNDLFRLADDVASATLTLGGGQDVIRFVGGGSNGPTTHVTVVDFAVGDSGDRIDWGSYLQFLTNWDPATNPFATGHFQFQTVGSDATLYIDRDGSGGSATLYSVITFQNVSPASLTAYNLGGYPANGGAPVGVTINGTAGDDDLYGAGGNDLINGGDGNDTLAGRAGNDEIHGDGAADTIDGELGNDTLYGGAGDDRLSDSFGTNSLYGEAGNDILIGVAGLLDGGADNDELFLFGTGIDARGGTGADRITLGVSGIGSGIHTIDAGDGDDVVILAGGRSSGTLLGTGSDTIAFAAGYLQGTGAGNFVVNDFQTGPGGDRIDLESLFTIDISNWDGATNPFASGHLRLAAGALPNQVNLYYDRDAAGAAAEKLLATFNNVILASFTADNFGGYPPDGSPPAGLNLVGTANDDTLAGAYGNDHIQGLDSNDTLSGSLGADHIEGGDGNDTITGGFGNDAIEGGDGDDNIDGGRNDDVIHGDGGNDVLRGGAENDQLFGDDGNDDVSGDQGNDVVEGGAGDDVLTDTSWHAGDNDTLRGGDGNDTLLVRRGSGVQPGLASTLVLEGGAGNDLITLQGSDQQGGNDALATITGGDGDDIIRTNGMQGGTIDAGAGDDRVELIAIGQTVNAVIHLGIGSDTVVIRPSGLGNLIGNRVVTDFKPGDGGDKIQFLDSGTGSPFPAWQLVQQGAHTLVRLPNYTVLTLQNVLATDLSPYNFLGYDSGIYNPTVHNTTGTSGPDDLGGADLNDNISGGDGDDVIFGAGGNDTLNGDGGNDLLQGSSGNDTLNGGAGVDRMEGGTGDDTYFVDNGLDVVVEAAGQGHDVVYSSVDYTLGAGQEVEVLSASNHAGTAPLNLTGNELGQEIWGNAGANSLRGGGGTDYLIGQGGNDTYFVDTASALVFESAGGGNDVVYASVNYALLAGQSVEVLSASNHAATTPLDLTGNDLGQEIWGNAGANNLRGGGGTDFLIGQGGNDTYFVDTASAYVFENAGAGNDVVYSSVSYTLLAGQSVEVLSAGNHSATNPIDLTGNELGQEIWGNAGANNLRGGGGIDFLIGQGGNDTYFVDVAGVQVYENAGGGRDVVYASISHTLLAGQAVEVLSTSNHAATTALDMTGNELAQELWGNAGANMLDGKSGNDALIGQGGADTFAFTTALGPNNVDFIADFVAGTDKIALDDAVFTGLTPGALPASAFVVGTAAGDTDDRIIYNSATGELYFDADGNGVGAAVQFATLFGAPVLTASDFTVI